MLILQTVGSDVQTVCLLWSGPRALYMVEGGPEWEKQSWEERMSLLIPVQSHMLKSPGCRLLVAECILPLKVKVITLYFMDIKSFER